jgi:hypothetical protein
MNGLVPVFLILLLGGPLSFALARISIRLQQDPSLAALASALIFWHLIALREGEAPLASAVLLLIGVSALNIFTQWLQSEGVTGRLVLWGLSALAFALLALAAILPELSLEQALLFCLGYGVACAAAWYAAFRARRLESIGIMGLPALGLMGLWLILRMAAAMIAALQ